MREAYASVAMAVAAGLNSKSGWPLARCEAKPWASKKSLATFPVSAFERDAMLKP